MSSTKQERPFTFRFVAVDSRMHLELANTTDQTLRQIEILTVFLKDEETLGAPSNSHIRFEVVESIRPGDKAVVRHRTWGGGKPIALDQDELSRLEPVPGKATPYILDLSWQDAHGKTRFQRIPVGH